VSEESPNVMLDRRLITAAADVRMIQIMSESLPNHADLEYRRARQALDRLATDLLAFHEAAKHFKMATVGMIGNP